MWLRPSNDSVCSRAMVSETHGGLHVNRLVLAMVFKLRLHFPILDAPSNTPVSGCERDFLCKTIAHMNSTVYPQVAARRLTDVE